MAKIIVAAILPTVAIATSGTPSCSDLCADGGHGTTGFVSGTAPFCGGVCADCGDGHCYQVEKGSVSDYGHGCTSGNKVCCCSKEMDELEQPSKDESHALAAEAPSCQEATGSFVQTTTHCTTDGQCVLHCQCFTRGQEARSCSYDLTECNHLKNVDGTLECYNEEEASPIEQTSNSSSPEDEAPSCQEATGSFAQTTTHCTTDGQCVLHCQCFTRGQEARSCSYDLTECNHLKNVDGTLECYNEEASPIEQTSNSSVGTPSCSQLCADGGHGTTGFVSGTAPFCGGVCADCGDGHCYHVEKGSVSDYGHGCTSGNKVCCCSKEMVEGFQTSV